MTRAMISQVKKINCSLILALVCLPIFTYAQQPEAIQTHSQKMLLTTDSAVPQPGEVKVTLHPLDNARKAENNYRRALIFAHDGENRAAETILHQALSQQPKHLRARELLVSLLLKRHAMQDAMTVLDKGIVIAPDHARFPLWLAQLHIKLNTNEQALNVLEHNAARFMQQPAYLGGLASIYQQSNRHTDAHQYFLQATKLAPQDGRWWLGLGIAAEELKDWQGAHDAYQRAKNYSFIDGQLLQFAQQRLTILKGHLQKQKG